MVRVSLRGSAPARQSESTSLSVEMSAACTFIRSVPVTLPGFITSNVPAFSSQS